VLLVGVDAASIVVDDQRCMASHTSCKEDSLPRCEPDEAPEAATHVCYTQTEDLLNTEDIGLTHLSQEDHAALKERLRLIAGLQTHLESHDRLGGGDGWRPELLQLMPPSNAPKAGPADSASAGAHVEAPKSPKLP
jgi:hypothetical protein